MKFGMCLRNDQIDLVGLVASLGYDYVEGRFTLFALESEEMNERFRKLLCDNNIKCESCNCFLPGDFRLTGENIDEEKIRKYIEKGMENAAKVGCEIVVFGSGGARSIPENFDREKGMEQIVHFLRDIAAPIAEKFGITLVTEPLKKAETNVINTVSEAAKLAERVNSPYVSSLGDLYHMYAENETAESLLALDGKVKHCHIADVIDRNFPKIGDEYDYAKFVSVMEKIGCKSCSVEGRSDNFEPDARKAIELLKSIEII